MAFCHTGVTLYGGPRASAALDIPTATSLHHEYNSMACTIEIVDGVQAAIDHIHLHGRYLCYLCHLLCIQFFTLSAAYFF